MHPAMSSPRLPPADDRYWEDYLPGATYAFGSIEVDKDEVLAFARRFDPQVFHVDEQAAAQGRSAG